MEHLTLSY